MTPTLVGRWQTRITLLGTVGILITLAFILFNTGAISKLLYVLGYVALFGLGWDALFIILQRLRWDRDWPTVFQVASGITEGSVLFAIIAAVGLPGIPQGSVRVSLFVPMYTTIWFATFSLTQGPLRILFPRWRFDGGRLF